MHGALQFFKLFAGPGRQRHDVFCVRPLQSNVEQYPSAVSGLAAVPLDGVAVAPRMVQFHDDEVAGNAVNKNIRCEFFLEIPAAHPVELLHSKKRSGAPGSSPGNPRANGINR